MVSSLDSLTKNLVGVNGMMSKECKSEVELTHIDKNYIAHGMCVRWRGDSHHKLTIHLIFDNLRVGHMDEQFQLLLRKGVYLYEYMDGREKFEENQLTTIETFYSKLNLSRISEFNYSHAQRD